MLSRNTSTTMVNTDDRLSDSQLPTLAEIMAEQYPPTKWAVEGILPDGVTILAGKPKVGKSWLALDLAIAIATGGYVFGNMPVERGDVLYLALEDNHRRIQKRARKLIKDERPIYNLYIPVDFERMNQGGIERLSHILSEHSNTRLVIIDTLARFRANEHTTTNQYRDDYSVGDELRKLAHQYNVCILIICHLRKSPSEDNDILDEISGTTGLSGSVDGYIVFKKERGNPNAQLHVDGRDIEEPSSYDLRWDDGLCKWQLMNECERIQTTRERHEIIRLLANYAAPMTAKEIAENLNKGYDNIRKLIKRMEDKGEIRQIGGNKRDGYTYALQNACTDYTDYPNQHESIEDGIEGTVGIARSESEDGTVGIVENRKQVRLME